MIRRLAPVLGLVLLLLTIGACASSTASFSPRPYPESPGSPPAAASPAAPGIQAPPPATAPDGRTIAEAALRLRGRPYRLGGDTPSGFDCSGLVQYVFAQYGIALPREVRDQFTAGRPVATHDIEPGDLLFFRTVTRGASHVGIALGRGLFVDAPSAHGHVRVDRLEAPYWKRRFLGARRIAFRRAAAGSFRTPD
ncbi:MAG TPA: C40 family peptidase [Vicinamibacterales bacterium]|nr:C40 family peptidase [Vicinamibacterales bacterium]